MPDVILEVEALGLFLKVSAFLLILKFLSQIVALNTLVPLFSPSFDSALYL